MPPILYISRRCEFAACHRLCVPGRDDMSNEELFGKCAHPNWHGHTYVMEVTVAGTPDPTTGMVMDLRKLKDLLHRAILVHVDHKNLNLDVPWLTGIVPTAENLCTVFWNRLVPLMPENAHLFEIKIWETENNVATYKGEKQ